jgi:hypothetical protein
MFIIAARSIFLLKAYPIEFFKELGLPVPLFMDERSTLKEALVLRLFIYDPTSCFLLAAFEPDPCKSSNTPARLLGKTNLLFAIISKHSLKKP